MTGKDVLLFPKKHEWAAGRDGLAALWAERGWGPAEPVGCRGTCPTTRLPSHPSDLSPPADWLPPSFPLAQRCWHSPSRVKTPSPLCSHHCLYGGCVPTPAVIASACGHPSILSTQPLTGRCSGPHGQQPSTVPSLQPRTSWACGGTQASPSSELRGLFPPQPLGLLHPNLPSQLTGQAKLLFCSLPFLSTPESLGAHGSLLHTRGPVGTCSPPLRTAGSILNALCCVAHVWTGSGQWDLDAFGD